MNGLGEFFNDMFKHNFASRLLKKLNTSDINKEFIFSSSDLLREFCILNVGNAQECVNSNSFSRLYDLNVLNYFTNTNKSIEINIEDFLCSIGSSYSNLVDYLICEMFSDCVLYFDARHRYLDNGEYKIADYMQEANIMSYKKDLLRDGFHSRHNIIHTSQENEFYEALNSKLKADFGWELCQLVYVITVNKSNIHKFVTLDLNNDDVINMTKLIQKVGSECHDNIIFNDVYKRLFDIKDDKKYNIYDYVKKV